ncbi:4'-phosphopantetheinyl transferase family protein [Cytobacillus horneckiae]|uniref:4'-phosphopantetheinyl transferase family protein n=1 Tax=Cytobacillus horneckiae TaxID=549687 RepID=UPI003D9A7B79
MIKVFACELPNQRSWQQLKDLSKFISKEKQEAAIKFKKVDDAYRTVMCQLLLQAVLYKEYQIQKNLNISYTPFGKPFLQNQSDVYFNLSHSGNWCVCAVNGERVGIDVEKAEEIPRDLLHIVLSNGEMEEYCELESRFFEKWTLKESYLKAIGTGLSTSLESVEIYPCIDGMYHVFHQQEKFLPGECKLYQLCTDYKLSVCSLGNQSRFDQQIHKYTFEEILQCQ